MKVLYNEYDKFAAAWLRALADAGHISKGEIDERSITDIKGQDTAGFIRAHFFAGIGGWEEALRLAGWPSDIPVWTGSCPCQPFSTAGKRKGTADARHLWPEFLRLIADRRPPIIFGEQVASAAGRIWLAGVRADLEALGYAVGAADLCAAGIGAPHIRQRLFWVAYAPHDGHQQRIVGGETSEERETFSRRPERNERRGRNDSHDGGTTDGWMGHPIEPGLEGHAGHGDNRDQPGRIDAHAAGSTTEASGAGDGMEIAECEASSSQQTERKSGSHKTNNVTTRSPDGNGLGHAEGGGSGVGGNATRPGSGRHPIGASWSRFNLAQCRDGKTRRFEPESFPMDYGLPGRVGRLRGYGNAIVPPLAAEFIQAVMEILGIERRAGPHRQPGAGT